jgi:uncharacterized membrane protein
MAWQAKAFSTHIKSTLRMKHAFTLSTLIAIALAVPASAQLVTLPQTYWASAVNNDGLVAGYLATDTTYLLWNPDLSSTEDIGGMSPSVNAGGQAKFSADGQLVSGGDAGVQGSEMATYDRVAGAWTTHGGLGMVMDGNVSSAWAISGDGSTMAGLAWVPGGNAHGVAWNTMEGIMDLGSLFSDASTRANAVSGDGSVVVGWQDFNGPWKSAVWRKDPAGGYYPNTYILIDPSGSATDEYNQAGECSAISADGSVIGGHGDYANNDQPWTWTEAGGFVSLGSLANMGRGYVSAISADGSIVVGWFDGQFFGDPRKAFIWTANMGLQDLNTYATSVLGVTLGDKQMYTASDISPDGRYIAGTGRTTSFAMFGYRLDLGSTTGIQHVAGSESLNAWPNPVKDIIHFSAAAGSVLTIVAANGCEVKRAQVQGNASMDLSHLAPGLYTLVLRTEGEVRSQRVVKQ